MYTSVAVRSRLVALAAASALTVAGATAALTAQGGAKAELKDAKGQVVGQATLTDTPHGVLVHLTLTNGPRGTHAFHIHETGKCEPPFTSAGGHFNPGKAEHGYKAPKGAHAGDLPNIHVPQDGKLEIEYLADGTSLSGNNAILDADGAALVIHATGDDYASNPAGNAGDRVACGVIVR